MNKVLVFAPYAAIWVHSFPEALILEALKDSSYEIIYITCQEDFENYCISMSAFLVSRDSPFSQKKKICELCKANKNIIKNKFNFSGYDFGKVLNSQDLQEIERILFSVNQNNYLDLIIDGIEIGRFSLYEFLLERKKYGLTFTTDEWSYFLVDLKNALLGFFAGRKIIEIEKPDFVMLYNPHYSANRMIYELAIKNGITAYFLHAGGNLSVRLETMMLGKGMPFKFSRLKHDYWKKFKDIPCDKQSLSKITDHIFELFKGVNAFAYSSPKSDKIINVYEHFNISLDKKILVATLSSYDERFAVETVNAYPLPIPKVFPTQVDWIKEIIKFAMERSDVFLIIRVHPREFPNKRDSVKSEHSQQLLSVLSDLPPNVKVNWPSDNLSLYDLAEYTDVFLNAWSSAGKEMSLLGIPVVIYSNDRLTYPAELNYLGPTKESYFLAIDRALKDGWSFEKIRMTYRWCVHEYERSTITLTESFRMRESETMNFQSKVFDKVMRKFISPHYKKIIDCMKRKKYLTSKKIISDIFDKKADMVLDVLDPSRLSSVEISLEQETRYLISELKRIYIYMSKGLSFRSNPSKLMNHFLQIIEKNAQEK